MKPVCHHMRICLIGNEETGLQSVFCEECGQPMTRSRDKTVSGEYIYVPRRDEMPDGDVATAPSASVDP